MVELQGTVQGAVPGGLRLAVEGASARTSRGWLFTGSNGPHCPQGLLLGRVVDAAAGHLVLEPEGFDLQAGALAEPAGGTP